MSVDVRQGATPTVQVVPSDLRAAMTSCTVRVVSPANVELATPTASLDDASATVESVAAGVEVDIDDATGFAAGMSYLLLADAGPEIIEVERVDAANDRLYLATRPSDAIRAGDAVVGATASIALPSSCTETLGLNYRIEWTITDTGGTVYYLQTMYHVVGMPLSALATPALVRRVLQGYSGDAMIDRYGPAVIRHIAADADDRLRQMIEQLSRRPHLYGDAAQFRQAAAEAVHVVLASQHTLTPASYEGGPAEWQRLKMRALREEFDAAVARLGWYDAEETREPDDDTRPGIRAAELWL